MSSEDPSEPPPLDLSLQSHLGRVLRKIYAEAAAEPTPQRFVDLLNQLEQGQTDRERPDDRQTRELKRAGGAKK